MKPKTPIINRVRPRELVPKEYKRSYSPRTFRLSIPEHKPCRLCICLQEGLNLCEAYWIVALSNRPGLSFQIVLDKALHFKEVEFVEVVRAVKKHFEVSEKMGDSIWVEKKVTPNWGKMSWDY